MKISPYLSKKIKFFTTFLILFVVIAHTYQGEIEGNIDDKYSYIRTFMYCLSIDPGRLTAAIFFFISGFLFFRDSKTFSFDYYSTKLKKRFRSLYVPYLIVSALGLLIAYLLYLYNDGMFLYNNSRRITDFNFINVVVAWLFKPQAYNLWFIRNLFYLCLLSPIIYFLIKKLGYVYMIPMLIGWTFFTAILPTQLPSIVFFSTGAFMAIKKIELIKCTKAIYPLITTPLCILFCYLTDFSGIQLPAMFAGSFESFLIIFGVISVWMIYDFVDTKYTSKLSTSYFGQYVFFVYLFHEPIVSFIPQLLNHYVELNTLTASLTYILTPIIAITFCCLFGAFLEKKIPRLHAILGGGR